MHANQRAGTLPIEVEISYEEFILRTTDLLGIVCEDCAGQSKLGVIRNPQCVIKILRLDDSENGPEDLLLRDRRVRIDVSDHRRLDEVAILRMHFSAGDKAS